MKKILQLLSGGLIKDIGTTIDKFVTTKEEKERLKMELKGMVQNYTTEVFRLETEDRNSARDMYKSDSSLQKVFAMVFLIAYMVLTIIMLYGVYLISVSNIEIPGYAISFVSTIWGAMSTKVSTITDFLFGGSVDKKKPKPPLDAPDI